MIPMLRMVSFVAGAALVATPSLLLALFANGVGEPPGRQDLGMFLPTLGMGLLLGGGLALVGLPRWVAGASTPVARALAALWLLASVLLLVAYGFSGSVTRWVSPVVIGLEVLAFCVFVFPARPFAVRSSGALEPTPR